MLARNISSRNLPSTSLLYNIMIFTVGFILEYATLSHGKYKQRKTVYSIRTCSTYNFFKIRWIRVKYLKSTPQLCNNKYMIQSQRETYTIDSLVERIDHIITSNAEARFPSPHYTFYSYSYACTSNNLKKMSQLDVRDR